MWEDLARHAEIIRDLTLIVAAIIGLAIGSWRLWLADKKDKREEEERTEQRECWKHEKRRHWQERFAEAVRQVYDETDSGTLSEARRIHALHDMAGIAENDPEMFMAQAKDVVERLNRTANAKGELWTMNEIMGSEEVEEILRGDPYAMESLKETAKTGQAFRDLREAAEHYQQRWEGRS